MIVAASRNLKIRYFCPLLIFNIFSDLSQPAGTNDFYGCRTAYNALSVQLVCDICRQPWRFKQHGTLMHGVASEI